MRAKLAITYGFIIVFLFFRQKILPFCHIWYNNSTTPVVRKGFKKIIGEAIQILKKCDLPFILPLHRDLYTTSKNIPISTFLKSFSQLALQQISSQLARLKVVLKRMIFCFPTFLAVTPLSQWSTWCLCQCPWWSLSVPGSSHQIISRCFMENMRVERNEALLSAQKVWASLRMWAFESLSGSSFSGPWGWIK